VTSESDQRGEPGESEQDREQSLRRIERGSIPVIAERRLRRVAEGGTPFTSDLSVSEFALGHQVGLRPLCQVMGSSVYQVGYQALPSNYFSGGFSQQQISQELPVLTHAWNDARGRAVNRLAEEARLAGADAVVGVRVRRGEHDWAAGAIEYVVVGTAVRVPGARPERDPVITDLSVQDYWKLTRAGVQPVGLLAATSVFFVVPSSGAQFSRMLTAARNQEYPEYTRGIYAARELALTHITTQAQMVGATGVVGVQIDQQIRAHELRARFSDASASGLLITFHVLGTAIRDGDGRDLAPPEPVVRLGG